MSEPWVVIMAGGSGTRFWPASRVARPKQFLDIVGGKPMLRGTYERVAPLCGTERCLVVCGEDHGPEVRKMLPELPPDAVLEEPVGRNTAPCVAWGVRHILARVEDAPVAVLPADHHIPDGAGLRKALVQAFSASREDIVLFGMVPTRPETGYGYIEVEDVAESGRSQPVLRFIEKPDVTRAEQLVRSGRFLWNSGMFLGWASALWRGVQHALPSLSEQVDALVADPGRREELYPQLESVSFDHGVLENHRSLQVLPLGIAWSDVGSWPAIHELNRQDEKDNVVLRGEVEALNCSGCLFDVHSGRLVAAIGAENLVVVDVEDALLVARREQAQSVKELVARLRQKGREDLL